MKNLNELENKANLMQNQINYIQQNLNVLQSEIAQLKNEKGVNSSVNATPQINVVKQPAPVQQNTVKPTYQNAVSSIKQNSKKDYESFFGKNMGVLASILIFIALISIGKLVIPYLNDYVKMILMFLVSFSVLTFSFLKLKNAENNAFYTTLLACSTGSIYISIIVSRIFLETISDIPMYIFLLLWGILAVFVSRKKTVLFQIIGNVGLFISVVLTISNTNKAFILPLILYIVIFNFFYFIAFYKNYWQKFAQIGFCGLTLILFNVITNNIFDFIFYNNVIIFALTMTLIVYSLLNAFAKNDENFFLLSSVLIFAICYPLIAANNHFFETPFYPASRFVLYMVLFIFSLLPIFVFENMNFVSKGKEIAFLTLTTFLQIFCVVIFFFEYEKIGNSIFILLLYIPFLLSGIRTKNLKIQNLVLSCFFLFTLNEEVIHYGQDKTHVTAFLFLIILLLKFILENIKDKDGNVFNILNYVVLIFAQLTFLEDLSNTNAIIPFTRNMEYNIINSVNEYTIFAVNIIFSLLTAAFSYINRNKKKINTIINIHLAFYLMYWLFNFDNSNYAGFLQIIMLLIILLLSSINIKRHIENGGYELVYAGIKYTIILITVLNSFEVTSYFVSVLLIIFALLCIFTGFKYLENAKGLRIYGLVLSLICTFKFMMIDIKHDNSISFAISLLISGVLCFGISALYNYFDKQNKN